MGKMEKVWKLRERRLRRISTLTVTMKIAFYCVLLLASAACRAQGE